MNYFIKHIDTDGHASAAIAYHLGYRDSKAEVISYNYSDTSVITELDLMSSDFVILTDVSFTEKTKHALDYIIEKVGINNVIWIDHHQSSIDLIDKYPEYKKIKGIRNKEFCGTYLTWLYFNQTLLFSNIPLYIKLINDHDLWIHNYTDTESFIYGLSINEDIKNPLSALWRSIINDPDIYTERCIEAGKYIKKYINSENKKLRDNLLFRGEMKIYDMGKDSTTTLTYAAMNTLNNSSVFGDVYNEVDVVIPFTYCNGEYKYSLFSHRKDLQLHKIAEAYGGGGHPSACGFRSKDFMLNSNICDIYINDDIINTNTISTKCWFIELEFIYDDKTIITHIN